MGAGLTEGRLHGTKEDVQHRADMGGITVQEVAQPFGQGEHPLAVGNAGQHVVDQVGGGSDHVLGRTRRAYSRALTAECGQKLITAGRTSAPGETQAKKSTTEIIAEGLLDVLGDGILIRVSLSAGVQPCLEVLLDDFIEHGLLRPPGPIDLDSTSRHGRMPGERRDLFGTDLGFATGL
jgi:hypothetical protein